LKKSKALEKDVIALIPVGMTAVKNPYAWLLLSGTPVMGSATDCFGRVKTTWSHQILLGKRFNYERTNLEGTIREETKRGNE
jgi:hypothetical protein